jgi:biopolymer transport protein ExbD
MAFGGGGGAGKVKSEINVTPLVDVVLVLLIIFLVTMPILMRDISIDIPRKMDAKEMEVFDPTPQLIVSLDKEGRLKIGDDEINRVDLAKVMSEKLERRREKVVFVDFADDVKYGDAVSIMDTVKGAGASTVALKMKEDGTPSEGGDAPVVPGH